MNTPLATNLGRPRNPERVCTDLMVRNVPKVLVDWLDAVSMPSGMGRNAYLITLLQGEAQRWAHAHIVGERVLGGNSVIAELAAGLGDVTEGIES